MSIGTVGMYVALSQYCKFSIMASSTRMASGIWNFSYCKATGVRNTVKIGNVGIRARNRETQLTPHQ
jgi:hypothetical protein